jgi:hypothetical protein
MKGEPMRRPILIPLAAIGGVIVLIGSTGRPRSTSGPCSPGETACFFVGVTGNYTAGSEQQAAKTDRLSWRFAWTGQV